MFKETFIRLCNQKGIAPTVVCAEIGLSNAAFSSWTESSVPRKATLMKLADYFGVTVDYLLGEEQKELASPLTPTLTPEEQLLLTQWRSHPDAQPFVRKLLDMPDPQTQEHPAVS